MSTVFPVVSGLSRRQPPLLLPGCDGQAPRALTGRDDSRHLKGSGGDSEVLVGASFGAPFKESEQLRSHERLPVSTSKPISPLVVLNATECTGYSALRERAMALRMSSSASRFATAWRLSRWLRPRARASSTFTRPSLK